MVTQPGDPVTRHSHHAGREEMLEKSRSGIEIHTDQGFNVGKPPYGYRAQKIKHPVPARRAEGKHKTKLIEDPVRGPVVGVIFDLRVHERLSYRAIAARLNAALTQFPPPEPVDPGRALGRWSPSAVREILLNPKYTGYMVWNRRATKDKRHPGKTNPREEWIISSRPEHPALVPVDLFLAAQQPPRNRERARVDAAPMAPNPHRQTKSVYRLRSHVHCVACQRRMHGKRNRHGTPYSYCQPRGRQLPDGHPATVWVREDTLLQAITMFFNTHVLGPDRIDLARASIPAAADHAAQEHRHRGDVIRRRLRELDDSMTNLVRVLEKTHDPDGQIFRRTQRRMAELEHQLAEATRQLSDHEAAPPPPPSQDVDLLHHLPITQIDLTRWQPTGSVGSSPHST